MTPWDSGQIFTNAKGVPIDRPELEEYEDGIEGFILFQRAVAEYNEKVYSLSSKAFTRRFNKRYR